MAFLYIFNLSNSNTFQKRNIAFICYRKNYEYSLLNNGDMTDKFNKKNIFDKILKKDEISFEDLVYNDIINNLQNNSIYGLHSFRGRIYLTIDNKIWRLGNMDGDRIVEYKLYFNYFIKNERNIH